MGLLSDLTGAGKWLNQPKYPGFVDRVQHIKYIYTNPCNVPRIYYVETALPALALALFEYVDFGVMDLVRGFTKPRALARGSYGCNRRRRRGRRLAIPDFGDEIGKKLRPDAMYNRTITNGQLHLWKIYGRLEHLMWWWMVTDISANFIYNWGSALYQNEYCKNKDEYNAGFEADRQTHAIPIGRLGISGGRLLYKNPPGPWAGSWGGSAPSGHRLHYVLSGSVEPTDPANPPEGAELGLQISGSGGTRFVSSGKGVEVGDTEHHVVRGDLSPGETAAPYTQRTGGGFARFTNVTGIYWATPA